uniref:Peptidase S1 domain-containing protein n=1 Tax=Panagrolaimus sp. PS1159 TaxID=55785 RepID=A0AC35FG54_9BILA
MLLKILILIFTFFISVFSLFRPTAIPRDVRITKINESMSQWLASTCGRSTEDFLDAKNSQIKGRRFPWAVSIMLFGKNKLGGSIISPYHILTAAHGFVKFHSFHTVPCQIMGYRNEEEIRKRVVAVGGDCIRGKSRYLPNHLQCNNATAKFNRIRVVYVDSDFASTGCIGGHDWAIGAGLEQRDAYDVATVIGITSFGSKGCPANELARFTRVSSYLYSICEITGVCYTIK